jgi:hypothetical protein
MKANTVQYLVGGDLLKATGKDSFDFVVGELKAFFDKQKSFTVEQDENLLITITFETRKQDPAA